MINLRLKRSTLSAILLLTATLCAAAVFASRIKQDFLDSSSKKPLEILRARLFQKVVQQQYHSLTPSTTDLSLKRISGKAKRILTSLGFRYEPLSQAKLTLDSRLRRVWQLYFGQTFYLSLDSKTGQLLEFDLRRSLSPEIQLTEAKRLSGPKLLYHFAHIVKAPPTAQLSTFSEEGALYGTFKLPMPGGYPCEVKGCGLEITVDQVTGLPVQIEQEWRYNPEPYSIRITKNEAVEKAVSLIHPFVENYPRSNTFAPHKRYQPVTGASLAYIEPNAVRIEDGKENSVTPLFKWPRPLLLAWVISFGHSQVWLDVSTERQLGIRGGIIH